MNFRSTGDDAKGLFDGAICRQHVKPSQQAHSLTIERGRQDAARQQ